MRRTRSILPSQILSNAYDAYDRWHPDKFLQAFGNRLVKAQSEKIMALVKTVFQELNNAKSSRPSFSYCSPG